jgi:hypothetical protein
LPEAFGNAAQSARTQHGRAAVFDQRQFAFQHIDEFVLVRMPVALARPIAGRQAHEIDAEISEPAGIAQPLPHALRTGRIKRRRIARTLAPRHSGNVDLRHSSLRARITLAR